MRFRSPIRFIVFDSHYQICQITFSERRGQGAGDGNPPAPHLPRIVLARSALQRPARLRRTVESTVHRHRDRKAASPHGAVELGSITPSRLSTQRAGPLRVRRACECSRALVKYMLISTITWRMGAAWLD
jgi:hypothetical protein